MPLQIEQDISSPVIIEVCKRSSCLSTFDMNKHIIALIKLLLLEERPYYSLENEEDDVDGINGWLNMPVNGTKRRHLGDQE